MKTPDKPLRATVSAALALLGCGFAHAQDPFDVGFVGGLGQFPSSLHLADLDADGRLDLIVASRLGNSLGVQLGDGDGGFGTPLWLAVGSQPVAVGSADLDADGHLDLFSADSGSGWISVLFGHGDGTFEPADIHHVGFEPQDVAAADLDDDGHLDLAVAADDVFQPLTLLFGDGARDFVASPLPSIGWCASTVAAADLDGDGRPELVVGSLVDDELVVLRESVGGGYAGGSTDHYAVGADPIALALADLDGDGHLDAVTADSGTSHVSVLMGRDGGSFAPASVYDVGASPTDVAVADFDGDERLDLITANIGSFDLSFLRGDGVGGFEAELPLLTGQAPTTLAVGDIDGDHLDDAVAASMIFSNGSTLINAAGPWIDLGYGSPMPGGSVPQLVGQGETFAGNLVRMHVEGLPRFVGAGLLVVGLERIDVNFKGGVLVPMPLGAVAIRGSVPFAMRWPHGLSDGLNVYWQAWFPAAGFASSNALRTIHSEG